MTWNSKHGNQLDSWISSWVIRSSKEEPMARWIVMTVLFHQGDAARWCNKAVCYDCCVWQARKGAFTIETTASASANILSFLEKWYISVWFTWMSRWLLIDYIWVQTFTLGLRRLQHTKTQTRQIDAFDPSPAEVSKIPKWFQKYYHLLVTPVFP